jgi:hypothetical protein
MRRRIRRIRPVALVALGLLVPSRTVRANDCAGSLSPCINDDTLWPHAGPTQFVAVGSTETVNRGQIGFGLVADYLSRPIVFHIAAPAGGGTPYAVDDQVNGTFLWSYGVTPRLELDLALPVTFAQTGAGLNPVTGGAGLHDTAVRDLRFGFAYALAGPPRASRADALQASFWGLAGRLEVSAPSGDRGQFAGDATAVFIPSLSAEARSGPLYAGAELGARIRPPTQLLGARVGTQIMTSLGVGVDILPKGLLSGALEAWALETVVGQESVVIQDSAYVNRPSSTALVPSEWLLSARSAPFAQGDLAVQVGGGGPIPWAGDVPITTPRFRFIVGLRWAPVGHSPPRATPPEPPSSVDSTPLPASQGPTGS